MPTFLLCLDGIAEEGGAQQLVITKCLGVPIWTNFSTVKEI